MKKSIIVLLISGLLSTSVMAQKLLNQVPSDANLVMEINLNAIKKHLGQETKNLDKSFTLPIFDYKGVPLSTLFSSDESGLNMNEKAYFFTIGVHSNWVLPLKDVKLFKARILEAVNEPTYSDYAEEEVMIEETEDAAEEGAAEEAVPEEEWEAEAEVEAVADEIVDNVEDAPTETPDYRFTKSKGAAVLFIKNYGIVIKNNIAILIKGPELNTYSYYGHSSYNEKYELKEKLKEYMREKGVSNTEYYASSEMKAKIKEIISRYEKEQIELENKSLEEADDAEEVEIEATEEVYEMEATEEVTETVEDAYEDHSHQRIYYDWNHPVLAEFDKEWRKYETRKEERMYEKEREELTNLALGYVKGKEKNSIRSNKDFTSRFSSTHDMGVWTTAALPSQYPNSMRRMFRRVKLDELNDLFEDNFSVVYLDVSDKSIELSGRQSMGKDYNQFQSIVSKPVNEKFITHLPKTTYGVYTMNVDPNETYDMYMNMYAKILKHIGAADNMDLDLSGSLDLFDMFINKDMLLNTLSGDALVALTGNTEIIGMKRKYQYDSTNFKSSWVMVPDTTEIPEMISMFTIKNKANLEKFLGAMVKLKVLKKVNNNYHIDMDYGRGYRSESAEKRMWTFGIDGDILFITNSLSVKNNQGLLTHKDNNEMNEEISSLLRTEGNFFYWDHSTGINSLDMKEFLGRRMFRRFKLSAEYFKTAKLVTTKIDNETYAINATLNFNEDNSANALLQMLELFQKMNERNY
jgi:hypothetical protein